MDWTAENYGKKNLENGTHMEDWYTPSLIPHTLQFAFRLIYPGVYYFYLISWCTHLHMTHDDNLPYLHYVTLHYNTYQP